MNILPNSIKLDVSRLSAIFESRSASYKFLLFKSIIDEVSIGKTELIFSDLALRAISYAWYSIHYYKLSLGYSDRMTRWVNDLDVAMKDHLLTDQNAYHKIYDALVDISNDGENPINKYIKEYIQAYGEHVPYRLISPWFTSQLKGLKDSDKNKLILTLSKNEKNQSLYKLQIDEQRGLVLTISNEWKEYLQMNEAIIRGWWKFNYILYLQKNNPTILSIATKIEPPISRNMDKIKKIFKEYYKDRKAECFYSGEELEVISHDHYFPWSFLGADPIYNFVPSRKDINSSKSNNIPDESYFNEFVKFQFNLFNFIKRDKKLESTIVYYQNDLHIDLDSTFIDFSEKFKRFYNPLLLSAKNQGFSMNWKYESTR